MTLRLKKETIALLSGEEKLIHAGQASLVRFPSLTFADEPQGCCQNTEFTCDNSCKCPTQFYCPEGR